jgi:hypothetical protein
MIKDNIISKEAFLNVELKSISQVYLGKRNNCRCGCGGNYTATSYMDKPRTEDINDKLVSTRLKKAKKLILEGVDVDYGSNYVDVQTGADRTLTFYFDELKDKRNLIIVT